MRFHPALHRSAAFALTLSVAGTAALALDRANASAAPAPAGIPGSTATVPLGSGLRALPADGLSAVRTDTAHRFSLLGVTWNDPRAVLSDRVQVSTRDRATGRWSGWQTVQSSDDVGPDGGAAEATASGARGGGAPLWVGDSDGVRVRVLPEASGRAAAVPAGLRLELVDPGREGARSRDGVLPSAGVVPGAGAPEIVSRAGWGADETLREPQVHYTGPTQAVFVHHTDTGNGYSCTQTPAIIRSIYRFHVMSRHWADIGYNFLVDKCGTVYEGRAGGVGQPVLGAHTLGFNVNTAGVAAIGTYTSGPVPQPLIDSLARLSAWKLSASGLPATGSVTLTSSDSGSRYPKGRAVTLPSIAGHRDADNTDCPGNALYAALPRIRTAAAAAQSAGLGTLPGAGGDSDGVAASWPFRSAAW